MKCSNKSKSLGFVPILIFGVFLLNIFWQLSSGDFIQVGEGFGWDGQVYGKLSRNLLVELKENGVPRNRIDRLLPVSLVYFSLRLTHEGTTFSVAEVIQRYRLANCIMLLLAICMFGVIAKKLSWSSGALYIACGACFFNFGFLKLPFYYSVLTDNFVLFLSVASLLAYLYRQTAVLAILTVLGAFSWSSALLPNLAMLAFPRPKDGNLSDCPANGRTIALVISIVTLALLCKIQNPFSFIWSKETIHLGLLGKCFVLILFYFLAWKRLLSFSIKNAIKQFHLTGGVVAIVVFVLVKVITAVLAAQFGRPEIGVVGVKEILFDHILNRGLVDFGIFYVPHVVYFGPGILVMTLFWPEVSKAAQRFGIGFVAVLSLFLFCSLNSESRHLLYGLPFFAAALGTCLTERNLSLRVVFGFLFFCLLTSRAWLTIGNELESRYFSNFGPWIVSSHYRIELLLTIISIVGLYSIFRCFQNNFLRELNN